MKAGDLCRIVVKNPRYPDVEAFYLESEVIGTFDTLAAGDQVIVFEKNMVLDYYYRVMTRHGLREVYYKCVEKIFL